MSKNSREILENLIDDVKVISERGPVADLKVVIDNAIVALDKYYTELEETPQHVLSLVEIDKDWIKSLIIKTGLVTDVGAERIAEGIKVYKPIKLIKEVA